jgi:hypothetical protein
MKEYPHIQSSFMKHKGHRDTVFLSDVLWKVARCIDSSDFDALHTCSVARMNELIRGGKSRHVELALAANGPSLTANGPSLMAAMSAVVTDALREGAVLLAVEYEVDDGGGGHQQHGDLLFWEPGPLPLPLPGSRGRFVAMECKCLVGGVYIETHKRKRTANAVEQSKRVAQRIQSWLVHLCEHDETFSLCETLCDGACGVAAATLTEHGVTFS